MAVVEQDEGEGQSREEDRVLAVSRADNAAVRRSQKCATKKFVRPGRGQVRGRPTILMFKLTLGRDQRGATRSPIQSSHKPTAVGILLVRLAHSDSCRHAQLVRCLNY